MNASDTNRPLSKKSFFGAAIGTMVEYYDYALFTIFMPIFAPLFFPAKTTYDSLVKGYYVILIAMLARPLGGLAFGYLGDAIGRRKALLTSMYGIALATTLIGLAPTYAQIGFGSILLVGLAKAIQVFCFGGEFNGAGIYVVEHAQNRHETLMGSLLTATTFLGSLAASLFGILATCSFMPDWSWRLAFILGGLIAVFGILYRKNMLESPQFEQANLNQHRVSTMLKNYPKELVAGIFIGGFATAPATTVLSFINPVLMSQGYLDQHQLMILQTFIVFCSILAIIAAGYLADRWPTPKWMTYSAWALALLSYPLLCVVDSKHGFPLIAALLAFTVLNEIFLAPAHTFFKQAFKMQYRYRASSFSFCIGMSLFGGLTPIVENYLFKMSGQFSSASLWLIFIGVGSAWSVARVSPAQLDHQTQIQEIQSPVEN